MVALDVLDERAAYPARQWTVGGLSESAQLVAELSGEPDDDAVAGLPPSSLPSASLTPPTTSAAPATAGQPPL